MQRLGSNEQLSIFKGAERFWAASRDLKQSLRDSLIGAFHFGTHR